MRLLSPWNSPGRNIGVGCYSLLQGIFPTQGSNPRLLHCGWVLYRLKPQGSPERGVFFSKLEALMLIISENQIFTDRVRYWVLHGCPWISNRAEALHTKSLPPQESRWLPVLVVAADFTVTSPPIDCVKVSEERGV